MNQCSECPKCRKQFRVPAELRRHQARKTPCQPIIEASGKDVCRYCGRSFASYSSMRRHVRQYCKIANSEEGMEKLMEHTLERQMAKMRAENALMREQMSELTTLMKTQLSLAPAAVPAPVVGQAKQVNLGLVINAQTVQQNIIITPWDGERRLHVDVGQIAAAFAENARLQEYVRLEGDQLTDLAIAPPYVTELLMDLTKRAHADPSSRNVYLNPRRADQALVHMASGRWEVLPLAEATRLLFDGVAQSARRVVMTRDELKQLPSEAQNALSLAGLLYEDEPDEYVKRAKGPMAAHLANTAPTESPRVH